MLGTGLDIFGEHGVLGVFMLSFCYLIYWFIKEKIYYIPDINGKWEMCFEYIDTEYVPYKNMKVKYVIHINQKDEILSAKAEKYFEELSNGQIKNYKGNEKVSCSLDGYIKRDFKNNEIVLNIEETGQFRTVIGNLNMKVVSPFNLIEGTFDKQDANSKGKVFLEKTYEL